MLFFNCPVQILYLINSNMIEVWRSLLMNDVDDDDSVEFDDDDDKYTD